jgi:glycosyltransferase involved in cell wall biosynthesis
MTAPAGGMRVFIGLTEISGYGANLKRGLVALGIDAVFLDLSPNRYRYGDDVPDSRLLRLYQLSARRRTATPRTAIVRKALWRGLQSLLAPFVLCWAAVRCDAFVLLYGSTFTGLGELRLLKLLRRKIVFVCVGSDVRPAYISGGEQTCADAGWIAECVRRTRAKKATVRQIERWADAVISHPLFGHLHERPFVKFLSIGLPRGSPAGEPEPADERHLVRFLHAPSDPAAKGTGVIRDVVEQVRGEGYAIEFVEVVGVPNEILLAEIARCDVVIDQLYGDTPMAGLAADAASLGKPTIVCGYGWDELERSVSDTELPPAHCCRPEELAQAVTRLAEDETYRRELGEKARKFLASRWSSDEVARRILRLLAGDIPPEWVCDPQTVRYVHGWGQSETQSAGLIRGVVEQFGVAALQLGDKPELEQRALALAGLADLR